MRSMTGFGRGVATRGGTRATVDARSVNHRFLDLKLRGGVSPAIEEMVSAKTRAALERGAVAISIHLAREVAVSTRIDREAAKAAHDALAEVATQLGLAGPNLALVLAQPGVITSDDRDDEAALPAVAAALDAALVQLGEMRVKEGIALATELTNRLGELDRLRATIATLAAGVPQQIAKRLQERIKRLLEDPTTVDPARLAQEVATLADRADITEELVRLVSHFDQARALIAGKDAVGRRLDFLVQEIGRELNTIGSKSTVAEITSAVVEAKATLEKVREQVQNVE
ncbi:MAG: YicC family protein [Deltaproteobacteria bacterium]|nr:YicC family protein [Deltaproteobacteria bacterium]